MVPTSTETRPRVLAVGRGRPERGGIATTLEQLVRSAPELGVDVDLLNLTRDADMGRGGRLGRGNVRRTIDDARALGRAAAGADIVHLHSALAPGVTLLRAALLVRVAAKAGAAVIVHAHGGRLVDWADDRARRLALRRALAPADRVVAVSNAVHDLLGRALSGSAPAVEHLPNGVELDDFDPDARAGDDQVPRILYVGHLTERKGVLDLLSASERLRERGVEHELAVLGGRSDDGDDEWQRVRAALGDGATLLGTVEHHRIGEVYASADVFCLPSWWEAMPLSVLEAMASGLPVVATDVGDVSRLVDDPTTGLLVPPKRPDELADALDAVLRSPDRARAMGRAGRARVTRFSAASMRRELARIYREVA